jgi:Protein of unknown function (DUF3047)
MPTDFLDCAERWFAALPADPAHDVIAAARIVGLRADEPPWHSTGIHVEAGQAYTLFASGRVQWSPQAPTLFGGPRQHLCARVSPGGRVVNPTCDSGTFVADATGELELGIYVGVWKNASGELATSASLYRRLTGGIDVLAIAWRGAPRLGVASLAAHSAPPFVASELARLRAPRSAPAEWEYLLETGSAGIFAETTGPSGEPAIAVDAHDDQGIVCKPVSCALTPQTRLSWRWRVSAHPSTRAEDRAQTHDYISIATEFDNGRDLTWIWSSRLAPGTHFHCPVGAWTARETHWVVRCGADRFGQWCEDERNVFDDVSAAMGAPPARIVRVWLIAVSSFQHGTARAEFSGIVLRNGTQSIRVL